MYERIILKPNSQFIQATLETVAPCKNENFDFQKQERILKFSNNLFLKNHNKKGTLTLTIENTTKIYQLRKFDFTKKKKKENPILNSFKRHLRQ